ncbi:MAG: immunoglobulin domain-containing protein [Opitutaceae bacterium]|nr:immunoglobulin domain-containing protein [Opitutaceae bacterium]
MMFHLRLAVATLAWIFGTITLAQTTPGAVIENSRNGRQVQLTLRSGPHPFAGDYPVTVFLPPNYDTDTAAYPVFYTFDAFDAHLEHDVLVQENLIHPAIFVAIANKTSNSRSYDLTPSWSGTNTGGLEVFADLITRELKAYLDTHFRTRPEAASTGVIGISLGGLAACWLGYTHPGTFGMAGCHEPSLWWNGNQLLNRLQGDTTPKFATRFWIMAADQEYVSMWQNAKIGANALKQRGWIEGQDVAFCQAHNYPHNWEAVHSQARSMLHFFLRISPPELVGAELTNCHGPQLVPLRPTELGGAAYAYLDLHFRHDLRTTAINPLLTVADPRVVSLASPVLGQLVPAGSGWTTVSTTYDGFRAVIDVQGYSSGSASQPPTRPSPPAIIEQPASTTVAAGGNTTLAVAATGEGTLTYQWRRDGIAIVGATSAALTLNHVTVAQAGDYMAVVTNLSGSTASQVARLNITPLGPRVLAQPVSRSAAAGESVTMAMAATGDSPLAYQWFRNGHSITGATSATLNLAAITPADAGIYDCAVSAAGETLSRPAVLGVLPSAGARTAGTITTRPEWQDISHPNGNTYDQFLLTGAAGTLRPIPTRLRACRSSTRTRASSKSRCPVPARSRSYSTTPPARWPRPSTTRAGSST